LPRLSADSLCRTHLPVSADEEPGRVVDGYYLPLLWQGWPRAWHTQDDAAEGYLGDLERVAQALHALNQAHVRAGHPGELRLALLVRCALLTASVRAQTRILPLGLVVTLVRAGVRSIDRAARVARQSDRRRD
jgi:hypothetical protein